MPSKPSTAFLFLFELSSHLSYLQSILCSFLQFHIREFHPFCFFDRWKQPHEQHHSANLSQREFLMGFYFQSWSNFSLHSHYQIHQQTAMWIVSAIWKAQPRLDWGRASSATWIPASSWREPQYQGHSLTSFFLFVTVSTSFLSFFQLIYKFYRGSNQACPCPNSLAFSKLPLKSPLTLHSTSLNQNPHRILVLAWLGANQLWYPCIRIEHWWSFKGYRSP